MAQSLYNLANLYKEQGRYTEAEPQYKRALAIREKVLGPDNVATASVINNLALLYQAQGRYAEAEPLYKRALAIMEKTMGTEHPHVAYPLKGLGWLYYLQRRYAEAEPLFKRALAIREKVLGPDNVDTAWVINNLAALYRVQARYAEAEPLYKKSMAIFEKASGPWSTDVASGLNNLALLYNSQARYAEAVPLYKRALAIQVKVYGADHPEVALTTGNLANLYEKQGRYAEAEPLHKRALAIREKTLGTEHPHVASSLKTLGVLYYLQSRYAEAEPLFNRALAIREKVLGPDNVDTAWVINNLAVLYKAQDRYAEVEPLYKKSLAIFEKASGPWSTDVASGLNNLALLYNSQARYAEAVPLYKRALAIQVKVYGADHPEVAWTTGNLANLYRKQGRYAEAELLYKRALAIREKVLGTEHPHVGSTLNGMAVLFSDQDRYDIALTYSRRSTNIRRHRAMEAASQLSSGGLAEQHDVRGHFVNHIDIADHLAQTDAAKRDALTAESFEVAQLASASSTGAAITGVGARFAASDDALARSIRQRQDEADLWQRLDDQIVDALGKPADKRNMKTEAKLRAEKEAVIKRISALDKVLARDFPDYFALTSPEPLPLAEAQQLLAPDEAMLVYTVEKNAVDETKKPEESFLWVVRPDGTTLYRLETGSKDLKESITQLLATVDLSKAGTANGLPPFDTKTAHDLYTKLLAPAEKSLKGVHHLFVVPDEALGSLPLGTLVTAKPSGTLKSAADYRNVPWLARRYALTTLPSVSSLRALRRFTKVAMAGKPFAGIGDPVLDGSPGIDRGLTLGKLYTYKGTADIRAVRGLPALPETSGELHAMARILGDTQSALYLRDKARESTIKKAKLSDYRVLAFATHGLVAGDLEGLAEPALVLTPPDRATAEDDGLLTASEVARDLKLNADWVILSACNTAAADGTPNASALSGLAKAFFYAGSRALLVSHWPVESNAAVRLTTGALKEAKDHPKIGRSEAYRRSMMALLDDETTPQYAHPAFWAPFFVVGEGGSAN
ncbi:CHAT domain-containing protein [Magnetospira thiophila]